MTRYSNDDERGAINAMNGSASTKTTKTADIPMYRDEAGTLVYDIEARSHAGRTRYVAHLTAAEWRWLTIVSCGLVLLVIVPLLWVALRGTPGWQFMGALHNYQDGATYLSKMMLGQEGEWLVTFQHTPEAHSGAFIQIIYLLLGHLSRVIGVPSVVLFHVARVIAALLLYAAIYHLAASIWMKIRSRRLFFVIASVGAGFGWLLGPILQAPNIPDLTLPEAFPLYSTFMNVHFPLTIGCLALLASLFITLMRPSDADDPTFDNGWWIASILSIFLAFLYPQALVPFGGALILYAASFLVMSQPIPTRIMRWILAVIVPALPIAAYYALVVATNPAMSEWGRQNVTAAPPPWIFVLGFSLPLLIALPGIVRAVRRMERDGDRLMLLWLIVMVITIYLPTNIQRRFAVAMMLPIAYFAVRALEEFWFTSISRRAVRIVLVFLIPLMAASQILVLFLPVSPALVGMPQAATGIFLERDYLIAYEWLRPRTGSQSVVLASPASSIWLPGWAGARVIYGHPYETLDAVQKEAEVRAWYALDDPSACEALLTRYDVRFILAGPQEAYLGDSVCLDSLRLAEQIGTVAVYAR